MMFIVFTVVFTVVYGRWSAGDTPLLMQACSSVVNNSFLVLDTRLDLEGEKAHKKFSYKPISKDQRRPPRS